MIHLNWLPRSSNAMLSTRVVASVLSLVINLLVTNWIATEFDVSSQIDRSEHVRLAG